MASTTSPSQPPMRAIDPQPMPSPSNAPYFPPPPRPQGYDYQPDPDPRLSPQLNPDSHLPNQPEPDPGSTPNVQTVPGHTLTPVAPPAVVDVRNLKANAQFHLREFLGVRQEIRRVGHENNAAYELESRLKTETGMILGDLSTLQAEVRALAKTAQGGRWSRLFVGGA
ncbi:hypothetical protein E4U54_006489, partial [Claviceps lovelessii]